MTTLQKALIVTALTAALGLATYKARQASVLRAQVRELRQQAVPQADSAPDKALESLWSKVETLEARNNELASALARANAEKVRLLSENGNGARLICRDES